MSWDENGKGGAKELHKNNAVVRLLPMRAINRENDLRSRRDNRDHPYFEKYLGGGDNWQAGSILWKERRV